MGGYSFGELYVFGLVVVGGIAAFASIGAWLAYFKISDLLRRVNQWEQEQEEED